jgi:copper(I)-binding protein
MKHLTSALFLTALMLPLSAKAQPIATPEPVPLATPSTAPGSSTTTAVAPEPKITTPTPGPSMTITNAYTFTVTGESGGAAVFMTLTYPTNNAVVPDRLLKATTPAAETVELHTMSMDGNVMQMRPIDSLPLPPTGIFSLKPQGVHVMLTELNQTLKVGDKFPITLVFEKAGAVTADVVVRPPGDIPVAGESAAASEAPANEPPEEKAVHEDMKSDHLHHNMNP